MTDMNNSDNNPRDQNDTGNNTDGTDGADNRDTTRPPVSTGVVDIPGMVSTVPLLAGYVPDEEIIIFLIAEENTSDTATPVGSVVDAYRVSLLDEDTDDTNTHNTDTHPKSVFDVTCDLADHLVDLTTTLIRQRDADGTRHRLLVVAVSRTMTPSALLKVSAGLLADPLRRINIGDITVAILDSYADTPTTATVATDHNNNPVVITGVPVVHWTNAPNAADMVWQGTTPVYPDFASLEAAQQSGDTDPDH